MVNVVFVGGPKDGQRLDTEEALAPWLRFNDPFQPLTPKQAEDGLVATVVYDLQTRVGDLAFYAPRGMSYDDTMIALIKGYKNIE